LSLEGTPVRITGLAKGSGMIEPNMATMLAFILTDAAVEKHALQCALRAAADASFNRITVDGDRSTNDSVLCLANGTGRQRTEITQDSKDWKLFFQTLEKMLFDLAMMIVKDGEGATRVVTVTGQRRGLRRRGGRGRAGGRQLHAQQNGLGGQAAQLGADYGRHRLLLRAGAGGQGGH
jgi:glutamate N-acetyltransferase/amino-acid N-acetyltransferase